MGGKNNNKNMLATKKRKRRSPPLSIQPKMQALINYIVEQLHGFEEFRDERNFSELMGDTVIAAMISERRKKAGCIHSGVPVRYKLIRCCRKPLYS